MDLDKAIEYALNGQAVLFLGSGFSMGATKKDGSAFRTATPLAHLLMKECGYGEDELEDELGDASQIYVAEKGKDRLLGYLHDEFTAVKVSEAQKLIASVDWARVYTTNYDNVFELAASKNKIMMAPVVLSDNANNYRNKNRVVIHINGSIHNLTSDKLDSEFRLTNRSYLVDSFINSDWIRLFKSDLKRAKAIFYVGYSMRYDLDIKRIIVNLDADIKNKSFFIVHPSERRATLSLLKEYGTPLNTGSVPFAEKLESAKGVFSVSKKTEIDLLCFRKPNVTDVPIQVVASDVFDLLFKGFYDETKVFHSLINPSDYAYVVRRTKQSAVVKDLCNGQKNILIHSDLGNGKTIFLEELATMLANKGFDVFKYRNIYDTLPAEVENICEKNSNAVFIIDGYTIATDLLELLSIHRKNQILIISERSASNDIFYYDLEEKFGEFRCFDLNRLDYSEIEDLSKILNKHGFWGDHAGLSERDKFAYIKNTCHASFKEAILDLLKSRQIISKYDALIKSLREKTGFYQAIIFILYCAVSQLKIDIEDLAYCLDVDQINSPSFKNDKNIREFIDIKDGTILPKSAIVSTVLLKEIDDSSILLNILLKVFDRLHCHKNDSKIRSMLKNLMLFSNIQNTVSQKKNKEYSNNINRYYDKLKEYLYCSNNEQFWLQYAIVKLSQSNYPEADTYFHTAYALANKKGQYDTYKIDNHYAKYLLRNAIHQNDPGTCMIAFNKAHELLIDDNQRGDKYYYPFTVAKLYTPFYKCFFKGLKESEQIEFQIKCQEMLDFMAHFLKNVEKHSKGWKEVNDSYKSLSRTLSGIVR